MMDSLVLSNQGLKNCDYIESDLFAKSKNIQMLDLSNNYLNDFNVSYQFPNLQILILDNNMISSIENFPVCKVVESLSINNNCLTSPAEFVMLTAEKFPSLCILNTLRNPMNPGFEKVEDYIRYRNILKKIKTLQTLDGVDINDVDTLEYYKSRALVKSANVSASSGVITQANSTSYPTFNENQVSKAKNKMETVDEMDEIEINNLIKQKKRQSSITYSQRMLKKADNLTKFNRKNHSEGNKHILNSDL